MRADVKRGAGFACRVRVNNRGELLDQPAESCIRFQVSIFHSPVLRDVTDIALDHFFAARHVDVADEFHRDQPTVFRF